MTRPAALLALAVAITLIGAPADAGETPPRAFTLAAAGDVLVHERLAQLAARISPDPGDWEFAPMLTPVEPWVATADFAICHLEGVLSDTDEGLSYFPRFIVPNQVADGIAAAGWDACSVAGNHSLDGGLAGITATLDELDKRGIGHTGTARAPTERSPALYEANGVTIAHLSFSEHFNGLQLPAGQRWAANELVVARVLADARWARRRGAEFVVVSLHWGRENAVNPTDYQLETAERLLTDPAVDLILGHHAHVVQPIGMVGDKYVVYGMGNHISNQNPRWGPEYYGTNDGLLVLADVIEGDSGFTVSRLTIVPTWVRLDDLTVFAAQDAIRVGAGPERTLRASIARTTERATRLEAPGIVLAPDPFPAVSCAGKRATLLGTEGADTLLGTSDDDVIVGRGGNDLILARGGDDVVCAGAGDDRVVAGPGSDAISGGPGADALTGDGLFDLLVGGTGRDFCRGGAVVFGCERP